MDIDFDPEKAFRVLDSDRDGFITSYEIYRFMNDTLRVRVSISEVDALIREFDGNLDRKLNF